MNSSSSINSLSFSQAITATQSLIAQIDKNQLSEAEIKQEVSSILSTKNAGRGFFVSYLTSDISLADNPSPGIIAGLKSSIEISSELLVKNLAMSSAMIVTHGRNNDIDSVEGSKKVCQRTNNLIQKINSKLVKEELKKLQTTIKNEDGEYQDFLTRWDYDTEQKEEILEAISSYI
jgi:hypothetical protein